MSTLTATSSTSATSGLTADELAHFHARGWVVRRGLIDASAIQAIAAAIDGLHERVAAVADDSGHTPEGAYVSWEEGLVDGARRIRQLMHSELVCPLLDTVSRSDALLAIMRQLIGPDVVLFHSKLMMKAARDGSFTPWHQDFQYWQHEAKSPTQINAMLYIDAADAANGALRFVDGSHHQGLQPLTHFPSSSFNIGINGNLDAYPDASLVPMQPGDVVFFGPLVIHGSGPNTSDRHRRANTFAFDAPGNRLHAELPAGNWRCGAKPS